ncbi:hypothetical protein DHEL01_v210766 [Diaporthe helianthi]|uniref:Heterokaryon incompatibility domain-containing protein n=1 Tax=Diaporthe helianthi TaxID=158607 RepID=A0A2P5HKR0_DIAHE|nr:hypothetical protein DHEL01_v210766 [Diaporthe helianthi]
MLSISTNIETFRLGIQVRDLASTFRDAIKMTEWLGFRYIWIDSLCIIQDSLTDWEVQSSLMASVYGSTELVLAASIASSTEEGFLKVERTGYRETSLKISGNKKSVLNLKYRLLNPIDVFPMLEPLEYRAWALEERLLARQYLAIGSYDTTWACTTCSAC